MRGLSFFVTLAVSVCAPHVGWAALIVNPPQPITHRVKVQLIQTALDNGTSPANVFGDANRRVQIEASIDQIWAQAGVDIDFLPSIVRYNDTFAYQGQFPTQVRPINDLSVMMTNAQLEGGILHPDPSVIDIFFVNIVPGWDLKGPGWVTGIGNVGSNGIAEFIGSGTTNDNIAHWVAHEIGHNLGLMHTSSGSDQNLMNGSSKITSQLTSIQGSAVRDFGGFGFALPFSGFLDGDYNRDGRVDSADYTQWRDSVGRTGPNLAADANHDNVVDSNDYYIWQEHFGYVTGSAAGQSSLAQTNLAQTNPEPATLASLAVAVGVLAFYRRHSRRAAV